jgi:hypothetical protein
MSISEEVKSEDLLKMGYSRREGSFADHRRSCKLILHQLCKNDFPGDLPGFLQHREDLQDEPAKACVASRTVPHRQRDS